jgi:two-component system phosphate regulon sensor histidine kinase PhoR
MEQQPTNQQLLNENEELRWQLEEANDAINAIRTGQVDALIVNNDNGAQLYTLKSADQTYRVFIEKMNEGAVTLNHLGIILYSNTKFATLVGRPLEQVIGFSFADFLDEDDKPTFDHIIKSSWQNDCKAEVCLKQGGSEIPCLLSCNAMECDGGEALSLIITDLSIQKATQKQLEQQFDQLEAAQQLTQKLNDELEETVIERTKDLTISREYLNLLTNNIPQMSWTNLPSGEVTFYNQRWYEYTGMTMEEVDGRFRVAVHADDRDQMVEQFNNALKTGGIFETECRYRRADGAYRWHLNRAVPLRNDTGEILFWVGTATDIEAQKQEIDKKDEFIGIASHELKTPLTSLKGYIQIMGMYKKDDVPPAIKQYIGKASIAVNKLQNLINDLLDVSKIQAGRLDYHMDHFDLGDMLHTAVENAAHIYPNNRIEHHIEAGLMVHGNAERIEQVLMNFISNAAKYSAEDSLIMVTAIRQNGQARVSVTDEGIGLTPGQQERIFERFYRVEDKTYSASGLGMGLYISAEIIQTHKGRIYVESEPKKGSTFYFELPLLK